jgi:hypothetical protein
MWKIAGAIHTISRAGGLHFCLAGLQAKAVPRRQIKAARKRKRFGLRQQARAPTENQ